MTLPGNPLPESTHEPTHESIVQRKRRPPITAKKRVVRVFFPTLSESSYPESELRASALAEAEKWLRGAFLPAQLTQFGVIPSDWDKSPRISHNRTPGGTIIAVVTWRNRFL